MGLFRNREKIEQEDIIKAEQAYSYTHHAIWFLHYDRQINLATLHFVRKEHTKWQILRHLVGINE